MERNYCHRFSQGISPTTLKRITDGSDLLDLAYCLVRDSAIYIASQTTRMGREALLTHFYQVAKRLGELGRLRHYQGSLEKLWRLRDYKLLPVREDLPKLYGQLQIEIRHVKEDLEIELGRTIPEPITQRVWKGLKQHDRELIAQAERKIQENNLKFLSRLAAYVSLIFFAFESSCKLYCSLSCWDFAWKIARNEVTRHNDVLKTLRILSGKDRPARCAGCFALETCGFIIDFAALARVFCYVMLTRMLADYSEQFYTFPEAWPLVLLAYFPAVDRLIEAQKVFWLRHTPKGR